MTINPHDNQKFTKALCRAQVLSLIINETQKDNNS